MQAIETNADTAEQQALQLLGQLAKLYSSFRVTNPDVELNGFNIRQALNTRVLRVSFRLVVPLATTAEGGLMLIAASLPEMTEIGSLSFWDEPMTFDNGHTLDF